MTLNTLSGFQLSAVKTIMINYENGYCMKAMNEWMNEKNKLYEWIVWISERTI